LAVPDNNENGIQYNLRETIVVYPFSFSFFSVFAFYFLSFYLFGGFKGGEAPIIVHPHPNPLPSRERGKS